MLKTRMKVATKPKRIKPVILDDSLVLNSDFLPIGFPVRERGKWGDDAIKLVRVNFPATGRWNAYAAEVAALMTVLALDFDDPLFPDDLTAAARDGNYKAWAILNAHRFKVKAVRDQTALIFFDYLDPEIEGMTLEESRAWINRHFPYQRVHEMFEAILDVEAWVKKNAISSQERMFRSVLPLSYTGGSPRKPGSTTTKSKGSPRSGRNFFLLDLPNPTPIN